ncbi:hypothetical protein AB6A40_005435 [Gnathostoma spinigerum]|uniref:Tudor domain-containing protein n=1 Tax=Gnathostoma spinigerum TaxID=75299 RepID=A0ABD6EGA3_9BILA
MVDADFVQLLPMKPNEMSLNRFSIHVLSCFDPDNISIRQTSLDPIPDYISGAVERDAIAQVCELPDSELRIGYYYAAKINGIWERVQLLGPSSINSHCMRVYLVDIGSFGITYKDKIRHLKLASGLRKIMMAKCKVSGIKPDKSSDTWSRESQLFMERLVCDAKKVEMEPCSEWIEYRSGSGNELLPHVPFVSANIYIDNADLAECLVHNGYAVRI